MHLPRPRTLLFGCSLAAIVGASLVARASAVPASDRRSTPIVASVDPGSLTPSIRPWMLTIVGQDFQPSLTLTVTTPEGGTAVYRGAAILSPSASSFRASVVLATAGRYGLVVTNPDGGVSSPYLLDVKAQTSGPRPAIDQLLPDDILKDQQPQDLRVRGRRFESGLRVIVTDPLGAEVPDAIVADLTASSFTLKVRLEVSGPYELVVVNPSGAASNVASFVVR